jgi:peroxin-16
MMLFPPSPPLSAMDEHEHKPSITPRSAMSSLQSSSINIVETLKSLPRRPSKYLDMYSKFVLKNASSVLQIESALRSLTYVIPPSSTFRHAEVASETLHSSIQLLSLYHDTLLARAVSKLPGMPASRSEKGTQLNRYTKYWTAKSNIYRRAALFLQCVRYTELLWEMAAKRRGEKVRWRVVVIIEIIKAVCRLILLRVTGGRMVVPPLPERDPIPDSPTSADESWPSEEDLDSAYASIPPTPLHTQSGDWTMPRTGLTLPSLPSPSDISSFLMQKVLTADDIKPATNLLHRIQGSAQVAELLHIIRPVIYALAMSRARNKKSWQPWLLGVSVELAARHLRTSDLRETALEKEEWSRRGWAMGWWGLRGAFYENVSKGLVDSVVHSRWMPGLVGGIVADYAFLWEGYHFASADM